MAASRTGDLWLYGRLLRQARPYWPHIAVLGAVNLLATPLALLTPIPIKIAVDSILGSHPLPAFYDAVLPANPSATIVLALTAGLMLGFTALNYLQRFGAWLLQTWVGERLVLDFRAHLFHHLQRLSLTYHDMKGSADSIYRIQYDAPAIQKIAVEGVMPMLASLFTLAGMLWVTARLDWQLALVAIVVTAPLAFLSRWSRRRLRSGWKEVKQLESSALSVVQEVLGAVRVVKSFAREDHEERRFIQRSKLRIRELIRVSLLQTGFDSSVGLLIGAATATSLFIGVQHVHAGTLSLGSLLLVMAYLAQLYEPLQTMSKKFAEFQSSLAGAERAFTLIDEGSDVAERQGAIQLERARGEIEFRDVSFAYPNGHAVHQALSFDVRAGARVGISGVTGAGKSTLLNLITRFYDPTAGAILLDGIDLREYRLADLRNQFALVHQEAVLFSTSIAENIAYARPGASQAEIEAAARAANAHDFIVSLPDAYDTLVGERGMRLSGGERQRISLARAFLKDAPILLLDEPTSSVDVKTEAAIMSALEQLMKGRTTLMIAHRLSTLEGCDMLLRIEHGRLVQQSGRSAASA